MLAELDDRRGTRRAFVHHLFLSFLPHGICSLSRVYLREQSSLGLCLYNKIQSPRAYIRKGRDGGEICIDTFYSKSSSSPKRLMHITTLRLPQLYNEGIMLGFITTPSQFLTRSPADALFVSEVLALRCTTSRSTTQRHTTDGDSLRGTPPGGNALLVRLLGSG